MSQAPAAGAPSEQIEVQLLEKLSPQLDAYVGKPGGLIPALQVTQNVMGYIPVSAMKLVSEKLGAPMSRIYGIVTFYSFFSLNPRGKYVIRVCMGTACYVLGANEVLESFRKELGIEIGGVTEDRLFSLEVGRCFGACGLAPVIMVNDDVHQQVKPSTVPDIINNYRATEKN